MDDEKVEASKQPQTTSETVQVVKKEEKPESKTTEKESTEDVSSEGGATPNLSAWFKAFGAPKSLPPQKKTETKNEKEIDNKEEKEKVVAVPDPSPSADSPQPIRQRRTSTGSSMSERSSFSQDLDSPRVGIDERAPFPYPSPSGASPRPDFSPKYPSFNGQMRVGFYQDTVSNKSSPDKNCSPRDNPPPSPYIQYGSDHVYAPNTTQNVLYSYGNSPYYSHAPNYSSTNPTPPYNMDASNPQYFDTSKSPSQLKSYPASSHSSPNSPTVVQRSPSVNSPQNSPMTAPQALESPNSPHALQIVQQPQAQNESPPKVEEKQEIQQAPMFPMKKRAYNESDPVQFNLHEYELKLKNAQQELMNRNILLGQQINIAGGESQKEAGKPPNFDNLANFARNQPKIDMSKFTNMGYSGPEVNYSRALQQQYARAEQTQNTPQASQQSSQAFKSMVAATQAAYNATQSENISERLSQMQEATVPSGYKPEMPIPRAGYNEVDQSILGRNISNLMERFGNDERIMAGLQTTSSYYTDKGLGTSMFNKNVPIFSQANMQYGQNQQAFSAVSQEGVKTVQAQEKKTKSKRKSSKPAPAGQPAAPDQPNQPNQQQGFQSYSNLKPSSVATTTIDPLKSTAAIAGSAFNFATGAAASLGLEAYPNFLDEFRGAPNYYMAAAAAHHRSADGPKEARTGATGGGSQAASAGGAAAQGFGFLGATQGRSGAGYPIGAGAFMPPAQAAAQLMETGSPLYQHYLQAGVLNHQGLLAAPPAAYPPGYHLNMRQAYDSMAAAGRAPWL